MANDRHVSVTEQDSYNRVKEVQKYRRLFFSLCWFHAILLERKKFKMLGWNIGYDFNDSDFDICTLLRRCDDCIRLSYIVMF